MTFAVTMLFHPTLHVPDLDEAGAWFERVFGRTGTSDAAIGPRAGVRDGRASDYSRFTPIADVLFDTIEPARYVTSGHQAYPDVDQPQLKAFGWYVENAARAYRELKRQGFRITDQLGQLAEGDDPPTSLGSGTPLFFTLPADAGLRYEFFEAVPFPLDPRVAPGWSLPPVSRDDPLGIERCSHHTVVTRRPERAVRLLVSLLGGAVVHEGPSLVLGASSTYVHLAGSTFEYAVPGTGTAEDDDLARHEPADVYHSITWKVADLDRVVHHLEAEDVRLQVRSDDLVVTDPETSLGVPWGFVTGLPPWDPRAVPR